MTLHIAKGRAPIVYTWPLASVTAGLPWTFEFRVWDADGEPAVLTTAVMRARLTEPGTDWILATGTVSVPEAGLIRVAFTSAALTRATTCLYRLTLDVALPGLTQRLVDSRLAVLAGMVDLADIPAAEGPGPGPPVIEPPPPQPLPVPILTDLTPSSVTLGTASMLLTCTGSNFVPTAVIWFDGRPTTTTFVNATTLQTTINPAAYTVARAITVQVVNDNLVQASAMLTFALNPAPVVVNPPVLTGITPSSVPIGSAPVVIDCIGSNFSATSVIWFGGVALTTTFVNATTLRATANPSGYSVLQTVSVQVRNADGQTSTILSFFLTPAPALPDPALVGISPSTAVVGSANFTLTCTGTGSTFTNSAVIWFNGAPLTTTFVDFDHLTATVQSSLETVAGFRSVQVRDGSHVSTILAFSYTAAVETVVSFFNAGAVSGSDAQDPVGQSLGLRIDPLVNGALTSVSYWRNNAAANPEGMVAVWHRDGTLLQAAAFAGHAGTGWKQVPFRLRYPMLSSDAYVAGVWLRPNASNQTFYKAQGARFTAAGITISGQLTAPPDNNAVSRGYAQKNGLYVQNSADNDLMMPVNSFSGGNYWIDVGWLAGTYPTVPLGTYPNARNTGHSGALTPLSGDQNITTNGTVYANKDIAGKLRINADNVTVQNCRIRTGAGMIGADAVVFVGDGRTGTKIYDCTIDGQNTSDGIKGIWGGGDIRRCNIFGSEDGISLKEGTGWIVQDNYIHDLAAAGSPHHDGVVIENTMSNVLIKHNTIRLPSSVGCVNISNQFGAVSNITVEDNVCEGGTYQIFTDTRMTASTITGIIVKDNIHINASWQYGLYAEFGTATMTITGATIIKPPPAGYFN